jgi:hypothetical protein
VSTADIAALIAARQFQAAIDAAIAEYQIDISFVDGNVLYDPTLAEEGVTSGDRQVHIGSAAFRSVAWLASTIAHEAEVHVNRQAMAGRWYTDPEGTALQEVEAYDYEIQFAVRFGLSPPEVLELRERRRFHYEWLSAAYRAKADAGDYTR